MFNLRSEHGRKALRGLVVTAVAAVLLFVMIAPAGAITYGQPDGNGHPNVGSIVIAVPDGEGGTNYFQFCSGTLISENVFLTASHCTEPLDGIVASIPGAEVLVTFDPTISGASTYYTGPWFTNPAYNGFAGPGGLSDPGDVAVIVLDENPPITPAQLPTEGLLDQLKASHTLKNTRFTAVGYGTVRETRKGGLDAILDNLDRNVVEQGYLSLTGAWLTLSMNQATGNGGTCYGDSGGPHFIHLNGQETNIVVSITDIGDIPCKATDKTYRVDTPQARAFLANFVDLP